MMRTDPERMILKVYDGGRIARPRTKQDIDIPQKINDEAIREIHAKPNRYPKPWVAWIGGLIVGSMAFAIGAMIGVQF